MTFGFSILLVLVLDLLSDFGHSGLVDDELDFCCKPALFELFPRFLSACLFGCCLPCCFDFSGGFLFSEVASLLFIFDLMELKV